MRGIGIAFSLFAKEIIAVDIIPGVLEKLGTLLPSVLSRAEMIDSRALLLPRGQNPTIQELLQVQPLYRLVSRIQGDWLIEILKENRITTFFQPIVHCHEPERIFAYECLLRGKDRDGGILYPGRIFDVARDADLLFQLDRIARIRAIEEATRHGIPSNLFINFNPSSVYDPTTCLRTTIEAVHDAGIPPERVVFEVVESEQINDVKHLAKILDHYRNAGFQVALDDLGAGYSSLNVLTHLRPDFVKLDLELVRDVDKDAYKGEITMKLLELSQRLQVKTIAEGIERPEEWRWLKSHGADYGQGYLFAKPACPPPLPPWPEALHCWDAS
ncbi:EAL domain-containing protein [Heliobacterium gestii]|uniref:EAL domain-containing protein n=1 Tax=Heliomicrobium gestii TaxID=2699 RepID=A0A845LDC8_HELGE|nr:EAL domain-containing protein [Heliomicrobium gestii]